MNVVKTNLNGLSIQMNAGRTAYGVLKSPIPVNNHGVFKFQPDEFEKIKKLQA